MLMMHGTRLCSVPLHRAAAPRDISLDNRYSVHVCGERDVAAPNEARHHLTSVAIAIKIHNTYINVITIIILYLIHNKTGTVFLFVCL